MSQSRQNPSAFKPPERGLLLPIAATIKGRVRWQVLDERGVPEVPRNESGFAIGPIEGVEQHNLITDRGMDTIGTVSVLSQGTTAQWRAYLAIGTGSTAPTFADTALVNEVETRSNSAGGFSPGSALALDTIPTPNLWRYELEIVRVVTMTASRNLNEFGLSEISTAGANLNIRELFRDGGGVPATISLISGKSLRLDHNQIMEIPAPEAGNVATINIDKYDATDMFVSSTPYGVVHGGAISSAPADIATIFKAWEPTRTLSLADGSGIAAHTDPTYARLGKNLAVVAEERMTTSAVAYTPGSHQRIKRATYLASQANVAWNGIQAAHNEAGVTTGGWRVHFTSPTTYTKVDTDTARIGFVSSWARG